MKTGSDSTANWQADLHNLPGWPHHEADEIEAALEPLRQGRTNQWTGFQVKAFGEDFAAFHGSKYAIPVSNGTVALELALRALEIRGDVIVPAATFVATASACVAAGAKPVIADVDLQTHGLSAETIEAVSTPDTQAVIPVHFGGRPVDIKPIQELCQDKEWKLIEDCAQAHGAQVDGQLVGTFGDIGCFSFCQDKILTTGGEGGMCITDDEDLFKRMWSYKDHGKDFDLTFNKTHPPGFRWLHTSFGTNWRMTEMQAAIGRVQLKKLPEWLRIRGRNANSLASHLANVEGLRISEVPEGIKHAYYKFTCYLENGNRDEVIRRSNEAKIPVTVGACSEIHREQAFLNARMGPTTQLTNAARLAETSLCIPVHPTLKERHMIAIAEATSRKILAVR